MRRITGYRRVAGGYEVTIARDGAYTDGGAAIETIVITVEPTATREEIIDAIRTALRDPLRRLRGVDVDAPITETRALWERRAERAYETWRRWKTTREEAQSRSLPAPAVTALTNRENAAWDAYLAILTAWRAAT